MVGETRNRGLGPAELIRAAAITRRYYIDGASKLDIAAEFGLSRFKVARVLEEARRSGLVRIDIVVPAEIDAELSEALRTTYGLHHAIVVGTADGESPRRQLGEVAAAYLAEVVVDGDVLGLACSRTLNAMTLALGGIARCAVVQLTGALPGVHVEENSVELVRRVASLAGGPAYPIYAPLVVADPATAAALREQAQVADTTAHYAELTKAVVAVGSWDPPDSLVRPALPEEESAALLGKGVRAEVCARLLDGDGNCVEDLNDRVIAITEAQLRAVPEVIGVAGGAAKAEAIRAVLRAGLVTSLVTDAGVARALLAGP
jgi:DNA-binding transcriptional regulator LsrR (DeoR family)